MAGWAPVHPEKVLNLSTGHVPRSQSLRQVCEQAKAQGARTLTIAFDHFVAQYRPGQDAPRRLMPDMNGTSQDCRHRAFCREDLTSHIENGALIFDVNSAISGRWLYGVE